MKRWVLSKIELVEDPDLGSFYRMAIQGYPDLNYAFGEIPVDPETGIPTLEYGFALVASNDMHRFAGDPDIDVLPDFPLDVKVNAMNASTRGRLIASLAKHGLASQIVTGADGFRDIVRSIGQTINPSFIEDSFDVNEV